MMEDLGDFNLMNSFKRTKTWKKYREIDDHFMCSFFSGLSHWNSNLKVDGSIPKLVNYNLLINCFLKI